MAFAYGYESFLCPQLFPFEERPNVRTDCMTTSVVLSLEHLSCKAICKTDRIDIAAIPEKYRAVLLMFTMHCDYISAIKKILTAWPSQNFTLGTDARKNFIRILDRTLNESLNSTFEWTGVLFALILAFVHMVFEENESQLVTLDIQDLPFITSTMFNMIFDDMSYLESLLTEEARSKKMIRNYKIQMNLYVTGMDGLCSLIMGLRTESILKFEIKCVIFDFGDISPTEVKFENLFHFNEMCELLNTDALKYFEIVFFVGADINFKEMVMSVPRSTFLSRLTSLSLLKYFSKLQVIKSFNENLAPQLGNVDSLSLGYCSLATRVCMVLYNFQNLRTLRLIKVGIAEYDLKEMKSSNYLKQIEHFDISLNGLCQPGQVTALIDLLQTWQSNLKTLEARSILWKPEHFQLMAEKPVVFEKLQRINITFNTISIQFLESLVNVETLKLIITNDPDVKKMMKEVGIPGISYFRNGGNLSGFFFNTNNCLFYYPVKESTVAEWLRSLSIRGLNDPGSNPTTFVHPLHCVFSSNLTEFKTRLKILNELENNLKNQELLFDI
ncbi:hypothetical protein GQR58_025575 [Nymphon striatum]|nr:hypothetical protein GQR58_025575 [Nymphon striatum]